MRNQEIEDALASDLHRGLLEDYFGEEEYAELRQLARESMRTTRGGQAVLILPGIMGSELGTPGPPRDDLIWVAYLQILQGRLKELLLPAKPGSKIGALGVLLFAYEKLKLRLRAAGFDADFFPFDWRQDLKDLGARLTAAINSKSGPVHLVAHSMGGLVARAACKTRPSNLKRIVTLGTPNYGSYSPIQAFRGVHSTVNKVALLDVTNSAADLAEIFKTFPGLCDMIPSPSRAGSDFFNLDSWPTAGVRPLQKMLNDARAVQASLPEDCDGLVQIVGCNRETVVKARVVDDEFVFDTSYAGDGTVPLAFARLPKPDTYYIEEEHGSLANNKVLSDAVTEILNTGKTAVLPKEPPAVSRILVRSVTETELRAAAAQKGQRSKIIASPEADGRQPARNATPKELQAPPSTRELRNVVSEFASPAASDRTDSLPALDRQAAASAANTEPGRADHVVVGRRTQRRLDITVALGDLMELDSSAYLLGLFSQVTPTGPAAILDGIMKGAISQMVERRMFNGNIGEITILPKGRHPLRPDFVAFAGLGPFDTFSEKTLGLVAENLVRTFLSSRVDDFATVAMGVGSGLSLKALGYMLTGFVRGLIEADDDNHFRGITICEIDETRFRMIRDELYRLCATTLFDEVEVTLRERRLPQTAVQMARVATSRETARGLDPAYLIVRQVGFDKKLTFSCSVLTTSFKATVLTDTTDPIEKKDLDTLLAGLPMGGMNKLTPPQLSKIGADIGNRLLPPTVRRSLQEEAERHLVVIHDTAASRIPWDAVYVDDHALGADMSHRFDAQGMSIAKWLHKRDSGQRLNVLLAVNPTNDLDGAKEEGQRIEALFAKLQAAATLKKIEGNEVTRSTLLSLLSSGIYDVLHYSGHSFFDPEQPEHCGLQLQNNEVVTGRDLAPLTNLPSPVFFNSCESARIRGQSNGKSTVAETVEHGRGVAEALLRGGIANFVGTYWPVRDNAAETFAATFYAPLMAGKSIGDSFVAARQAVRDMKGPESADWADYALYGNKDFVLQR